MYKFKKMDLKNKITFILVSFLTFSLTSCLITEFSEVPEVIDNPLISNPIISNPLYENSSSSNGNLLDSNNTSSSSNGDTLTGDSSDVIQNEIPVNIQNQVELNEVPLIENSFHGIASAVEVKNTDGIPLSAWNDSLVVLVYFGATCPHCLNLTIELLEFSAVFKQNHPEIPVNFLTLATSSSSDELLEYFIESSGSTFPIYRDQLREFSLPYGTGYVPEIMIFDLDGIAWHITDSMNRVDVLEKLLLHLGDI